MNNNKVFFPQPIQPLTRKKGNIENTQTKQKFQEVFQKELIKEKELKFSKHAQERLSLRNIELGPQKLEKLNSAVDKAAQKGSKESLILMDDLAFVVSVKNKTVITAIDGENIKDNVFTNIDSAVIV